MISKHFIYTSLCFFFAAMTINAQQIQDSKLISLTERTQTSPEFIFKKFREAGMNPTDHKLTDVERQKVNNALSVLPPLHQKILKEHLQSISFMDNMPNTALTSPIEPSDSLKMYNITFRAEILNQTISEWTTWKENTYYVKSPDDSYQIAIDAGNLDAFIYVLLHEATHVVDAVLDLTPHLNEQDVYVGSTAYTQNIWEKYNKTSPNVISPLLETTLFKTGKPMPVSNAANVYKDLRETPFVSLYSTASWYEDLAEMLTIYHLTEKMKQPYKLVVKKNGIETITYEPNKNKQVKKRQNQLQLFYKK